MTPSGRAVELEQAVGTGNVVFLEADPLDIALLSAHVVEFQHGVGGNRVREGDFPPGAAGKI